MEQIIFRPKLYKFDTLKAFTDEFKVGGSDLILTNKYIYDPYSDNNKCGAQVIYQEEFGGGEPTDTMVDAIIAEASKKHLPCSGLRSAFRDNRAFWIRACSGADELRWSGYGRSGKAGKQRR